MARLAPDVNRMLCSGSGKETGGTLVNGSGVKIPPPFGPLATKVDESATPDLVHNPIAEDDRR